MDDLQLLRLAAIGAKLRKSMERAEWNPLQNDGDALKLVVKLRLDVFVHDTSAEVYCGVRGQALIREDCDGTLSDRSRATRRAIVRAAAARARLQ
jgi:hypothetical protein